MTFSNLQVDVLVVGGGHARAERRGGDLQHGGVDGGQTYRLSYVWHTANYNGSTGAPIPNQIVSQYRIFLLLMRR